MTYIKKIECILKIVPHKTRVLFAIYCAESVVQNLDKETKAPALAAIESAKAWVKSPTEENASAASAAASAAYHVASNAAYAASNAAYAAHAAYYAAYAASAAAHAASAASYAASATYAANAASHAAKEDKFKEQYQYLLSISDLTKLEKILYEVYY